LRARRFGYGVSRIRGMKARILTTENYDALLKASDLAGALQILRGSAYASCMEPLAGKEFDLTSFEKELWRDFIEDYRGVLGYITGKWRDFLVLNYNRFEAEYVKAVFRAFYGGGPPDEMFQQLASVGRFTPEFCTGLLKKGAPAKILEDSVEDRALRQKLLQCLPKCEEAKSSLPIETAIDNYYFTALWKLMESLPRQDRVLIRRIIGTEIDVSNINFVLRAKLTGLEPDFIASALIPIRFKLGDELDKSVHSPTVWEAVKALATGRYGNVLLDLAAICEQKHSVFPAEMALKRLLISENLVAFLQYPFQLGPLLAYLNLKFQETKDIQAILIGKANNVPADRIVGSLVLYGVV